ncbi:hypothetical protein P168DRAFT_150809 [Aspergillus campestris IBT 28561]|uniref:Uncharacterized protein n=1 Tax=Aspergillus campestris (strain IBT 28561) TaxID=1392248 RepID=A0A2I1D2H7_ASPC2|nr:uncharacterized protein P168DRAFT_150809 [Aspergillus campestris IBT 28561]PKY04038.1 hypothetical protein P168DRAFT_150809 [Aspergillus campestris IBT 28561]
MSLKCLFDRIKNLSERTFQTKVGFLVCASTPPVDPLTLLFTLFISIFFFFFFFFFFSTSTLVILSFLFFLSSPLYLTFPSPSLYPFPLISGSPRPSFPSNGQRLTAATLLRTELSISSCSTRHPLTGSTSLLLPAHLPYRLQFSSLLQFPHSSCCSCGSL